MLKTTYDNWQVQQDNDQLAWLTLNKKDASTNTLNQSIFNELEAILNQLKQATDVKGVVIQSGKSSGFIAGAEIEQFVQLDSEEAALTLIRRGQTLFDQLEALPQPTVALIDGFCLGGGLELALACTYRIAEKNNTKLGLPEVMLGIHPGWGGSVRLPRLIGALKAMGLILTGRSVSAKAAKAMGFVDAAVDRRYLVKAARSYLLKKPKPAQPTWLAKLSNQSIVRPFIAKLLRSQLHKKVREVHYPAPYEVVNCWEKNGVDASTAFIGEAESLAKLQQNDTAKNLVRVYFLQNQLKALGKSVELHAKNVHVVGAGTMGGDIAAWCALKGYQVTLQDSNPAMIGKAVGRAYTLFKQKLKDRYKIQAAMDRLTADVAGFGIAQADVIIEAIFENLEAKQNLFRDLETKAKSSAILATNTSSIPLDEIAQGMKVPSRLVGIHFFNPVAKMMLVEVVRSNHTDAMVFEHALAFVHHIDKLPVPVKSSPGFLVNRVLMPYLMECMLCLNDGFAPELIDAAAVDFGMPMGPVQLADTVGLDVCLSVARNLVQHYGGQVPDRLAEMVSKKELGVKTGKGFYAYKNGKPVKNFAHAKGSSEVKKTLADRMIYRMLNESMACLREQVVTSADFLDAGMIFGTGFAPFRGGPLHYAKSLGKEKALAEFSMLKNTYGDRFTPDAGWASFFTAQ